MMNYPEAPRKENIPTPGTKEQALADLAYLWTCDDSEWMKQREADWQKLVAIAFDDYPKPEKRELERYFKYGKKSAYMPIEDLFFLTPYNSEESLLQFFNSRLLSDNDRASIYGNYIFDADRFSHCGFYRQHTSLFIDVILGDTFVEVIEKTSPHHSKRISPPPALWCTRFVRFATEAISAQVVWKPLYQCLNYFISILPYALDERDRKRIKLPELLRVVSESLAEGKLTGELLVFAQALKDREQDILQAWDIGEQKIAAMAQQS